MNNSVASKMIRVFPCLSDLANSFGMYFCTVSRVSQNFSDDKW